MSFQGTWSNIINPANALALVLILGGFVIQNREFTTHVRDFEQATNQDIAELKKEIKELRFNKEQTGIIQAKVEHMENSIEDINRKLDVLLERELRNRRR
jgi:low affinity Fe/Cu permease